MIHILKDVLVEEVSINLVSCRRGCTNWMLCSYFILSLQLLVYGCLSDFCLHLVVWLVLYGYLFKSFLYQVNLLVLLVHVLILLIAVEHTGHLSLESNDPTNITASPSPSPSLTPTSSTPEHSAHIWQGIAFFLQNLFIFMR